MIFIKFLQGIGDRLGILESVSTQESAAATRIQTRIVSLQELAREIRSGEVTALADGPGELLTPFEKIFEAAGISCKPDDWTMERLTQVIKKETEKLHSKEAVQKAVLDLLQSEGISSEILVKDAIARDQALDAFEARVQERMSERSKTFEKRLREIETQVKSLEEESAKTREILKADEETWREWKRDKRVQERELAASVGYLVDRPVITMDEEDIDRTKMAG
jgi:hypothetical protein